MFVKNLYVIGVRVGWHYGRVHMQQRTILLCVEERESNSTQLSNLLFPSPSPSFVSSMAAESNAGGNRPLQKISDAFKGLAAVVADSQSAEMELASFSRACSSVSPLFGLLGIAFKFAEKDYVSKVRDLEEASKSRQTLQSMIDQDVRDNCVRNAGSHTRNLLRVRRGLDMVRALFEEMLVAEGSSIRDPALKAYEQALAPYHPWAIRMLVSAGMYTLPTKEELLSKFNEDEASARVLMQNYVTTSATVIQYVDKLFISRDLGIAW